MKKGEDRTSYDRLRTLSAEYDPSVESLVDAAVKRLGEDVDVVKVLCWQAGECKRHQSSGRLCAKYTKKIIIYN